MYHHSESNFLRKKRRSIREQMQRRELASTQKDQNGRDDDRKAWTRGMQCPECERRCDEKREEESCTEPIDDCGSRGIEGRCCIGDRGV